MMIRNLAVMAVLLAFCLPATAQTDTTAAPAPKVEKKKWYETIAVRGYAQVRYNRLLETNENLGCEQCDRSWGKGGGFFLRRARLVFSGQVGKQVSFYVQPDFATTVGTGLHFAQLRDAYFDVGLDKENQFRFRIGQSKVPYGFENMQSSQNRLGFDRNDAFNSAVANERDLGVMFFWAPKAKREMFSSLVSSGLKGTGDYGVVAVGVYNGQTANLQELNDQPHVVARVSYPLEIKGQIVEAGVQAYSGKYTMSAANISSGNKCTEDRTFTDQRAGASFILYPKPFGLQAEYNIGRGPEFNKQTDSIEVQNLQGGYVQAMYSLKLKEQGIIPFVRYQYYDGGKKHERDARSYNVHDLELGVEWQPMKQFEMTAVYTISQRRYEDFLMQDNFQKGNLLRLQAQVNF